MDENYEAQGEGCQVSTETSAKYDDDDDDDEDEQPHLPAGQHLLVDIKNVNHDFLTSEQRLAQAMVDVVWESARSHAALLPLPRLVPPRR